MDTAHRDRLAFIRICSGVFERGMVVTHARTGRPFATKYAQHVFGRDRESIDVAYPGDVVGLVNATALGVGDTLYAEQPVQLPAADHLRPRALRRLPRPRHRQAQAVPQGHRAAGLRGRRPGAALGPPRRRRPVLAVVGPMQFEVATHRMEHEFGAPVDLDRLPYSLALRTDEASAPGVLAAARNAEVLQRANGELLAVFARQVGPAGAAGEASPTCCSSPWSPPSSELPPAGRQRGPGTSARFFVAVSSRYSQSTTSPVPGRCAGPGRPVRRRARRPGRARRPATGRRRWSGRTAP